MIFRFGLRWIMDSFMLGGDAIEHLYTNRTLVAQMKQSALRAAKDQYNVTKQAGKLLKLYETV